MSVKEISLVGRPRKFLGLGTVKTVKFGTFSKLSILRPIFIDVTHRNFRLGESLKTAQAIFIDRHKCTYLTVKKSGKYIPGWSSHKNIIINTAVQSKSNMFYVILSTVSILSISLYFKY